MPSHFARDVEAAIARHRMLERDDRILVGVSAGADSLSLLLALCELGYTTAIAHLNHGLRGIESDKDEDFTAALAERLQLPFFSSRAVLSTTSGNLEAACRDARREFFQHVMEDSQFNRLALAHTRDDRVETFLLHLMRGSGLEGLVSMAPVAGRIVRPLIETGRAEIEGYLKSSGQTWRTDATNRDVRFSRNRMRHVTIPELARNFNPRLRETLSRTVEVLHDEDQWMRSCAERWLRENGTIGIDEVAVDALALAEAPAPLVRRVIRTSLKQAGSSLSDVTFDHVEQIRSLLQRGKSGKRIEIPGELVAVREFDRLVFLKPPELVPEFTYQLTIPGTVHIPELCGGFRAELVDRQEASQDSQRVFVDGGSLGPYVRIRNWQPGDYYRPVGWPAGKLKKLFVKARIPRSQRNRWPVFVAGSAIVWVASFPVSREFAPCGNSQKIVAFEAVPE